VAKAAATVALAAKTTSSKADLQLAAGAAAWQAKQQQQQQPRHASPLALQQHTQQETAEGERCQRVGSTMLSVLLSSAVKGSLAGHWL
jgi:hypothetical protein